ncbi:MAG: hypothetical protein EXS38_05825 [Opitutus sp.]|nr:hypothetical protein [Opitutus sp.]
MPHPEPYFTFRHPKLSPGCVVVHPVAQLGRNRVVGSPGRGKHLVAVVVLLLAAGSGPLCAQGPRAGTDPVPNVDPMSLLPEPKTRDTQRVPIFFPPTVPPLDLPVAHGVVPPGRLAAPPELAMFVNELFYPALSTHLFASTLYGKTRNQVGDYHAAKLALQKELRGELARLREADPATRRAALETFASAQTPRIVALEKEAERLRRELVTVGYSWGILREWYLKYQEKRGFSPKEVATVMRGYAYYQNGLTPRQRRLLQEIMIELLAAVDDTAKASAAQPYLFFSPEPARVLLPADLPADLSARIAAYQAKKSVMKKELYDAVCAHDGAAVGFWYNPLKTLMKKQVPAFVELDAMAEDIRRCLAQTSATVRPTHASPLPPVLADRVSMLLRNRAAAERTATVKADAIVDRTYEVRVRVAYRFDEDGMKYVVVPGLGRSGPLTKEEERFYEKVRTDLAVVADEYGRRLAELLNEEESIRRDAAETLGTARTQAVNAALLSTKQVVSLKESEEGYRDYRLAVFEPGLSAEQRRQLLDGAIERLELPLPRGEMQITTRTKSW